MAQRSRYELKYVINEEQARAVTRFVRMYLRSTPFNRWGRVPGQPIISLYFDSPDLLLFRQSCEGIKNRMKLRIRFYNNDPSQPAFLEVKRRISDVICKARAMVSREAAQEFLRRSWPDPTYLPDPRMLIGKPQVEAYNRFWSMCCRFHARAMVYVSYLREAYDSPADDTLRVTLDRQIHGTVYDGSGKLLMPTHGVPPPNREPYWLPPESVVLELKFDERAPRWMIDLAQTFNLRRRPVSKYCACVEGTGLPRGRLACQRQEFPLMLENCD